MRKSSDLKTLPLFDKLRTFLSDGQRDAQKSPEPGKSPNVPSSPRIEDATAPKSGSTTPRSARDKRDSMTDKRGSKRKSGALQTLLDVLTKPVQMIEEFANPNTPKTPRKSKEEFKNYFGVHNGAILQQEEKYHL